MIRTMSDRDTSAETAELLRWYENQYREEVEKRTREAVAKLPVKKPDPIKKPDPEEGFLFEGSTLHWDCETRSRADLRKVGLYAYAAHPTTEVLMIGYRIEIAGVDTPYRWFMPGDKSENERKFKVCLKGHKEWPRIAAHNAGFERRMIEAILAPQFGYSVPALERYDCTAARAAIQSLPRSLDGALRALGASAQKDMAGHRLMLQMCKPRKIIKSTDSDYVMATAAATHGSREFTFDAGVVVQWWWDPDRVERLAAYMLDDVKGECTLDGMLAPMTPRMKRLWVLTEKINDRGVPIDAKFANIMAWTAKEAAVSNDKKLSMLTGGAVKKATNVAALKRWLVDQGVDMELSLSTEEDELSFSLDKRAISDLAKRGDVPESVKAALEVRMEAGKVSVKKYDAMLERMNNDGRARGNLVFHAASTGRYAGAGVQMQNMLRAVHKATESIYADLKRGMGVDEFESKYGLVMTVLSQCVRAAIRVNDPGAELYWADYAAVEARGVAWLAGADELTNLFATGAKVYEHMAGKIFDMDPALVDKDGLERWVAKQVVLGCGYGLGPAGFVRNCDKFGQTIDEKLATTAVYGYRTANPEIPALWKGLEQAAIKAVRNPGTVYKYRLISFRAIGRAWLQMRLPSGRIIWYCRPKVELVETKFGTEKPQLSYEATNTVTKKWERETTWGGKLTENAVQGLCADLMMDAMERLENAGYVPILSVHDEIICQPQEHILIYGEGALQQMVNMMCQLPDWATGFPLAAEGKRGQRYGK